MTNEASPLDGRHSWEAYRASRERFLARFSGDQTPEPCSQTIERVQSVVTAWNAHDPKAIALHFTTRGVRHQLANPEIRLVGREGIAIGVGVIIDGLPDCAMDVEAHFSGDDGRLIVEWTLTGTHENRLLGLPATGAPVRLPGVSIFSFNETGHIAAERVYWDTAALMPHADAV